MARHGTKVAGVLAAIANNAEDPDLGVIVGSIADEKGTATSGGHRIFPIALETDESTFVRYQVILKGIEAVGIAKGYFDPQDKGVGTPPNYSGRQGSQGNIRVALYEYTAYWPNEDEQFPGPYNEPTSTPDAKLMMLMGFWISQIAPAGNEHKGSSGPPGVWITPGAFINRTYVTWYSNYTGDPPFPKPGPSWATRVVGRGLSVGAYKSSGQTWFDSADVGSNYGDLAGIGAPGYRIWYTDYSYAQGQYTWSKWSWKGTSLAAPYAAGLALLLHQRGAHEPPRGWINTLNWPTMANPVPFAIVNGAEPLTQQADYNDDADWLNRTPNPDLPLRLDYLHAMRKYDFYTSR